MPPKRDHAGQKKNLRAPSPDTAAKRPRRSARINSAISPPAMSPPPENPDKPIAGPSGMTPTHPQSQFPDTQVASQVYFPSTNELKDAEEEEKDVWGYLTPMNSAYGEVLALTKRPTCDDTKDSKPARNIKGSKKKQPIGYLIGRHSECDIVVQAPVVSNRHCVIFKEVSGSESLAIVEDLSSNGTFVNSTIVGRNRRRTLAQGDEITVAGGAVFVFRYPHRATANRFKDSYTLGQRLGSGHFATVHIATEKSTGTNYAVKMFRKPRADDKARLTGLQQEIAVLMSVSHPSVLCLKETFDEEDGVYLVLELARGGELFEYIIENSFLPEEQVRKVFLQLFNGLKYLHERNIVHRDIKPENILICDKEQLTVKLADFGLAKIVGEDSFTTSLCGTPSYVAPEILENSKNRRYSRAVDIWSLGVVLYICLCGFPPFSDELYSEANPYNLSQQIRLGRFDFPTPYWDKISDGALDLIDRMLTVDPERRITVEEALDHPWTQDKQIGPFDSTDSLTGAFNTLHVFRKKAKRERTLLSTAIKNSRRMSEKLPVVIHQQGKDAGANGVAAATTAFMKVGGKGVDETLYTDAENSRSEKADYSLF